VKRCCASVQTVLLFHHFPIQVPKTHESVKCFGERERERVASVVVRVVERTFVEMEKDMSLSVVATPNSAKNLIMFG